MIEFSISLGFDFGQKTSVYNGAGWEISKEFDKYGFLNISLIPPYGSAIGESAKIYSHLYSHLDRSFFGDYALGFNFEGSDYRVFSISLERDTHVVRIGASREIPVEDLRKKDNFFSKILNSLKHKLKWTKTNRSIALIPRKPWRP